MTHKMAFDVDKILKKFGLKRINGKLEIGPEFFADIAQKTKEATEEAIKDLGHANIIVAGGTGVGKSTLINAVFGKRLAKTGMGRPVTDSIDLIELDDIPISIYDTKGFELSGENSINKLIEEINNTIEESRMNEDPSKWIHMLWYCISLGKPKIQDAEVDYIKALCKMRVPVIIVITQAFSKKQANEFKQILCDYNIGQDEIIPVLAEAFKVEIENDEDGTTVEKTIPSYGVDVLTEKTFELLPEAAQKAFVANQKASIRLKQKAARKYIAAFAATNFATGYLPIPMSDAPALILSEILMMGKISAIFGYTVDKKMWISMLSTILGCSGATILGKTAVSALLKFIPGVGTIGGGTIAGSTAAALTYALGEAYIQILTKIEIGEISKEEMFSKNTNSMMKNIIKSELKKQKEEKKNQ